MIPRIATMIGAYIIVQMVSLMCSTTQRYRVKVLAFIAIVVVTLAVIDVWVIAVQSDREQAAAQQQIQRLQQSTP